MDMPSFYGALVQALLLAHQQGWKDRGDGGDGVGFGTTGRCFGGPSESARLPGVPTDVSSNSAQSLEGLFVCAAV